jgi:two-component system KDP operon response regulator KdpE
MSPCRILVVDDDATTLHLLGELLDGDDRHVVTAANAKEAYRRYLEQRPDVIVIDLGLPGEGGLDIANQLLEFDGATVILLYSGYIDEAVRRRADLIGVRACIEKPGTDELVAVVSQHCPAS